MNWKRSFLFSILGALAAYSGVAYSKDRCEELMYKDCVPMLPGESFPCLTKAGVEEVRSYYRRVLKNLMPGSELVENSERGSAQNEVVYTFRFRSNVQGTLAASAAATSAAGVRIASFAGNQGTGGLSPLAELEKIAMSMRSGYTRKDYDSLATQYRHLRYSYFRSVQVSQDETKPEDQAIYEKYYVKVYGVPISENVADEPGEFNAEKRKKMEEAAKKLKELYAQGKMREAVELSAQMQKDMMSGTTGERLHKQGMSKEAWKLWVQCLEELNTAAYRTQISCAGL